MKTFLYFVLCLFIASGEAAKPFKWSYCNPKNPGVIRINKLQVSPSPLPSPGIFYVTMEEETLAPLNSSKVELSVKKLGLINIPVPCITKFGSCTYDDTCTLLDEMEKENYAGLLGPIATALKNVYHKKGLHYKCPVPRQKISVTKEKFPLPATSSVMKTFLQGDFKATIKLIDNKSNKEFFCINVEMSVSTGCTGWLCGRR